MALLFCRDRWYDCVCTRSRVQRCCYRRRERRGRRGRWQRESYPRRCVRRRQAYQRCGGEELRLTRRSRPEGGRSREQRGRTDLMS